MLLAIAVVSGVVLVALVFALPATARAATARDLNEASRGGGRAVEFLDQINKASIVMLDETGLVPRATAATIARGVLEVIARERRAGVQRSADYLDFEPKLIAQAGQEASLIHTGRSRQDMGATIARMSLRDVLLAAHEALAAARGQLLGLAQDHTTTIIPAYTHGVQAQPTTFAHSLLAHESALARDCARLGSAYGRINLSPLGAAALATSSFAVDRRRLAELLGFDGLIENSFDANHLATVDGSLEVANALQIIAIQLGQFAQDIHAQYADPKPWITLSEGKLTGVSSIMPQKRNPAALEQLRTQCSLMAGDMHSVLLVAHNTRIGMFDYRSYDPIPLERPQAVLDLFRQILDGLVVNPERALAEVNADYSTATGIADTLQAKASVPFRTGHHFASELTTYGRSRGLKPREIPYAEAARIYAEQTKQEFPLDPAEFAQTVSPEHMVAGCKGAGGPQPAEVERMLALGRAGLEADLGWLRAKQQGLKTAEDRLDAAVAALAARAQD